MKSAGKVVIERHPLVWDERRRRDWKAAF